MGTGALWKDPTGPSASATVILKRLEASIIEEYCGRERERERERERDSTAGQPQACGHVSCAARTSAPTNNRTAT